MGAVAKLKLPLFGGKGKSLFETGHAVLWETVKNKKVDAHVTTKVVFYYARVLIQGSRSKFPTEGQNLSPTVFSPVPFF